MFEIKPGPIEPNEPIYPAAVAREYMRKEAETYERMCKEQEDSELSAALYRLEEAARAAYGPGWYDKLMHIISLRQAEMSSPEELRKKDLDDLRGLNEIAKNAMWDLQQFVEGACEEIQTLSDENERLQRELDEVRTCDAPEKGR